jgi:hypothetical protein
LSLALMNDPVGKLIDDNPSLKTNWYRVVYSIRRYPIEFVDAYNIKNEHSPSARIRYLELLQNKSIKIGLTMTRSKYSSRTTTKTYFQ